MKKDAPVAVMRIAAPVASVKRKKKKTFLFWFKIKATTGLDFYQTFSR